jgi:hypothetical protein
MRTDELTGAALDWAVAECEGDDTLAVYFDERSGEPLCRDDWPDNQEFKPSTDWAQGGPIIERERLLIQPELGKEGAGNAWYCVAITPHDAYGATPLIAAMRCYVASKLGDEIETPEGLNQEQTT